MKFKKNDKLRLNISIHKNSVEKYLCGTVIDCNLMTSTVSELYYISWNGNAPSLYTIEYIDSRYELDKEYYRNKNITNLLS